MTAQTTITAPRTIPEASIDTLTLKTRLDKAGVGEVVTYSELSELIGRDVQREAYGNMHTAARQLIGSDKVFEAVRGIGLKRLSDTEVVDAAPSAQKRIRRITRIATRKLKTVDYAALDDGGKTRHNTQASILGALTLATSASAAKRIEQHVMRQSKAFDPSAALEMLRK